MIRRILNLMLMLILTASVANAKVVDKEEAARVAAEFLSVSQTKQRAKAVKVREVAPRVHGRRLAPAGEEPAFYIFTPEDGCGFVIVSADDTAIPVLGYSDTGTIDEGNIPPALADMMETWTKQICEARSRGIEPDEQTKRRWAMRKAPVPVVYLETAEWDQGTPYNGQCPMRNGKALVTGCGPTAYAILMRYYRYTKRVSVITEEYTCESGVTVPSRTITGDYDWNNMPLKYPYSRGYGDKRDHAVAQLMADIGALCKANYGGEGGTGTFTSQPEMLDLFGYHSSLSLYRSNYTDSEWNSMILDDLDKHHPVLYSGSGPSGGHGFLLDGYDSDHFYHVNWGWGGAGNGYFTLNSLQLVEGVNYNNDQEAVFGIYPIDENDNSEPEYVAQVGTAYFSMLNYACEYAACTGEAVKQLCDTSVDHLAQLKGNIVLDINGYTLTTKYIYNFAQFTIQDSKKTGKIIIMPNDKFAPLKNAEGGTLTLENVTIEGSTNDNFCMISNYGTAVLRGCKITGNPLSRILYNAKSMDIYDSEITCEAADAWLADCYEEGVLNIHGGKYLAKNGFYTYGKGNVYEGLFSFPVYDEYIAEGSIVENNTDPETSEKYPYWVYSPTAIPAIATEGNASRPLMHYSLDGKRVSNPRPGTVVITRNSDGSVVKKIMK